MSEIKSQSCDSTTSAVLKRKHLSPDAKLIIKNVYDSLLQRGFNSNDASSETSDLTKTALSTVKKIVKQGIEPRKKRRDAGVSKLVDEGDRDVIRRKVYAMYAEQRVPTVSMLKFRLSEDETNISCSFTSLRRILSQMGFKYRAIAKKQVVMESQRLRQWRFNYINSIREYRSANRPIIYLDETWFDTHDTPNKGWTDMSEYCQSKAPSNKGKRITIIHAGSEKGFVPNCLLLSAKHIKDSSLDYHQDTNAELFEGWFKNRLLPNIPQNSVIVMDNASYHSRQLKKTPCSNSTKATIQDFMLENDIYFDFSYNKKELLQILKAMDIKKAYVCDTMAAESGHTVLRLPPYYCVLNPIEQMWHQLKSNIRRKNLSPTLCETVIDIIKDTVEDIPVESWKHSVRHVIEVENSYVTIEKNCQQLIIRVDENDSDSDTELSDI